MTTTVYAVMSGKGGVGKSTIASALAIQSSLYHKTLLLDFDICGPSQKTIFNINQKLTKAEKGLTAAKVTNNLDVITMASLIKDEDSVIWRGPKKLSVLQMFYESITDYEVVVIDTPPGLTEEHYFLKDKGVKVVIVTTPQNVALSDAKTAIDYCQVNKIEILGVIENMSGFRCVNCDSEFNVFARKGGEMLAEEVGVRFLGAVPLKAGVAKAMDKGDFVEFVKGSDVFRDLFDFLC